MKKRYYVLLSLLAVAAICVLTGWYLSKHAVPVLQPRGTIGMQERNLIYFTALISIVVVVPVFALLAVFAWKYREGNTKAKYTPELDGSRTAEGIWWAIPGVIMIIISIVTWQSSYALDPHKPLISDRQTLNVQVVSLDWKWLFIYPDYNVASVNELAIPVDSPVALKLTSDSVMNSFWVPALSGQIYTMNGMSTKLNFDATETGTFSGRSANISGKGFADMKFSVRALNSTDFNTWIENAQSAPGKLDQSAYDRLARPSKVSSPQYYSSAEQGLYDTIVMKYMMPRHDQNTQKLEGEQ